MMQIHKCLVVMAMMSVAAGAQAQKNNLYADVGLSMSSVLPGASVTYSRKLLKWVGIGAGVQGYTYDRYNASYKHILQFTPAVFGDLRFYMPARRHELFILLDVGEDFYSKAASSFGETVHDNGIYTGLGVGYAKALRKLRIKPYLSFKIVSDTYKTNEYYSGRMRPATLMDATFVLSGGVKF